MAATARAKATASIRLAQNACHWISEARDNALTAISAARTNAPTIQSSKNSSNYNDRSEASAPGPAPTKSDMDLFQEEDVLRHKCAKRDLLEKYLMRTYRIPARTMLVPFTTIRTRTSLKRHAILPS